MRLRGLEWSLVAGSVILAVECGFAAYSASRVRILLDTPPPPGAIIANATMEPRVLTYIPLALLCTATILAGVVVVRALQRHFRPALCVAAAVPIAVLLLAYPPPGINLILYLRSAGLPWAAPTWWTRGQTTSAAWAIYVGAYVGFLIYLLSGVARLRRANAAANPRTSLSAELSDPCVRVSKVSDDVRPQTDTPIASPRTTLSE